METLIETSAPALHPLLHDRYSPFTFSARPVSAPALARLFEAARWAPSSYNEQPWRFVYGTKEAWPFYSQLLNVLVESNKSWARQAPVLVAVLTKTHFALDGRSNEHARYDTGGAVAHLTVQAAAEGLQVHQMGGFDRERARLTLCIPTTYEVLAVLAIGYPGLADQIPADVAGRASAPRQRRPLAASVHEGHWNSTLE